MRRTFWYFTAFCLIVIGIAGLLTLKDWKLESDDKLPTFEKTWTFSAPELRKLQIVSDYNISVTFAKSTDGLNSIRLNGRGSDKMIDKIMSTRISDQSLKIDLTKMSKNFFSFFNFSISNVKEELMISVTDDALLDSLKVKLDSGNLTVKDAALIPIRDAELSSDSGNMTIDNFTSDHLKIKVDSGNIKGNGITAELKASTDSGNITLEGVKGITKLSVDSGNIKLYRLDTSNTDLSADSGNVYVQVPSSFAGVYDLRVDSGRIKAPSSKNETTDYVKARVDSGNITIEEK